MANSTERDIALTRFETAFTQRLVEFAEHAAEMNIPADLIVRGMLAAGISFAMRFDSASSIGAQLAPIVEAMKDSPEILQ